MRGMQIGLVSAAPRLEQQHWVPPAAVQVARRNVFHMPVLAWGAAKVTSLLGGAVLHKRATAAFKRWFQQVGVRRVVISIKELNDSLFAAGIQGERVHAATAASLSKLELGLKSLSQNEQIEAVEKWLAELEKQAPELVVAVTKLYLETFTPFKVATSLYKDLRSGEQESKTDDAKVTKNDFVKLEEWEQRIHTTFPELQRYHLLFVLKEGSKKEE